MRLITNLEMAAVSGGEAGVPGGDFDAIQVVEIRAKRMGWVDRITLDIFGDSSKGGLSMADHNILQAAYGAANETGHSVPVQISRPQINVEVNLEIVKFGTKSGDTTFTVTVDPADCNKRPNSP